MFGLFDQKMMDFVKRRKTVKAHDEMCCNDKECILSDKSDFVDRTRDFCLKWSHQVCSELGMDENSVTEDFVTFDAQNIVRLCDYCFHFRVSIYCENPAQKANVLELLMKTIEGEMESSESDCFDSFNEFTWILTSLAIAALDLDRLQDTLARQSCKNYPTCYIQSLLIFAINKNFLDGVKFLLNWGAKAHRYLYDNEIIVETPINVAVRCIHNFRGEREKVTKSHEILKLILISTVEETGKSPFLIQHAGKYPDMDVTESLYSIFKISPRSAHLLIDYLLEAMLDGEGFIEVYQSMALEFGLDAEEAAEIAKYILKARLAVSELLLPLLRSGARHSSSMSDFEDFEAVILDDPVHDEICIGVWGRTGVFAELVFESSVYNAGQVPACAYMVPNNYFPMTLARYCRRSLLKALPIGLEKRSSAIESLKLPFWITKFLNYSEFEPIPSNLDHELDQD